jgi:hypothetical protein
MRATFIPSFFPKPLACTLAVSCKRLRTVVAQAMSRPEQELAQPVFPSAPGVPRGPATNQLGSPGVPHRATLVSRTEPEPWKLPFSRGPAEAPSMPL